MNEDESTGLQSHASKVISYTRVHYMVKSYLTERSGLVCNGWLRNLSVGQNYITGL